VGRRGVPVALRDQPLHGRPEWVGLRWEYRWTIANVFQPPSSCTALRSTPAMTSRVANVCLFPCQVYPSSREADADPAECDRALAELAALTDDLGPARSDQLRHEEARHWWAESGCCPWCGQPGGIPRSPGERRCCAMTRPDARDAAVDRGRDRISVRNSTLFR
jgi:hypothetical protein